MARAVVVVKVKSISCNRHLEQLFFKTHYGRIGEIYRLVVSSRFQFSKIGLLLINAVAEELFGRIEPGGANDCFGVSRFKCLFLTVCQE